MTYLAKLTASSVAIAIGLCFSISPAFAKNGGSSSTITSSNSSSFLLAYSAIDDAYYTCVDKLAEYGITVTELVEANSGKGGASLILRGYNSARVPVTASCTLSLPSRELSIEYL